MPRKEKFTDWGLCVERLRQQESDMVDEITRIAIRPESKLFVHELAEYFRPTEIVLVLQAAKAAGLIE